MKYLYTIFIIVLGANLVLNLYHEFEPKQPIIIQNHIPACGSPVGKPGEHR